MKDKNVTADVGDDFNLEISSLIRITPGKRNGA
jgi:hypothetical protein